MFHPRMKLFALLASAHILPLANAECSPYLNERPSETSQEPEKCWICPQKGNNGFQSVYQALPDWEDEATKSWDNFYCKYGRSEGQDENGNSYKRSTIFCQYNNKGELRVRDSNCPSKAIAKPNCTPSRPYSGPQQLCCGDSCKLETDQCFACPAIAGTLYVDVAVNPNILACFGNFQNGMAAPKYYFDAQTGNLLTSLDGGAPPSKAPLREGCVPKPVAVPGANCAAGVMHDQCVKEAQQDAYRSFNTWNRCRPQEEYCKYRTMGTSCWACPRIEGTDAVDEDDYAAVPGICRYYKRNTSGVLESANTVCGYNLGGDGNAAPGYNGKSNALACPSQSDQDLTCARLKKAAGK